MESIFTDAKKRMEKAITNLEKEFSRLRTGRASASLVDGIQVSYYNTPTPLNQLASISIPDARTIAIQPWDRSSFENIEKAIMQSDLGLNPVNDGKIIRINIPALTEERRKELVKIAKKHTEDAKIAIRNIRRDANEELKKQKNDKTISEDDMHRGQEKIQKLTDEFVDKAEKTLTEKEKEIMEI
ncbi:ribosome recycling factor [Desulfohalobium retbaense]|uniref:Ribosome-recycling factor n=1 Tax=Desulfohalobium retbaense (strain ATCC 49708 / DSM 5692 / JCM 16813 / HR100) TaxID=485915 RepID=C8X4K5_DESRD|nr:ribosome recycling factor [Desulfohalobium retbaense]ACV69228.1 ribosome recycling factor [Desulfohalobium retbaense DSM 5692]